MEKKNILPKVLINSAFYLPTQILIPILGLITIPFYTRLFPPEEYGLFVLITTTISFMRILSSDWIDSSTLRFSAAYRLRKQESIFVSTFFFALAASIVTTGIVGLGCLFGFTFLFSERFFSPSFLLGIAVFIIHASFLPLINLLRASEQAKPYTYFRCLYETSRIFSGIVLAVIWYRSISSLLWGWLVSGLILLPLLSLKLHLYEHVKTRYFSKSTAREITTYGFPFIASGASWMALSMLDRYLLQLFRGSEDVGIYNISYMIANWSISSIFSFLMMAGYPAIVSTWEEEGPETTRVLIKNLVRIYFLICLPVLIGVSVLSKQILIVLTTGGYLKAYTVIPFVAFGAFSRGVLQYTTKSFILLKKSRSYAILILSGVVINVILNLFLIPHYGFWGSGLSTALSYLFVLILSIIVNVCVFKLNWSISFKSFMRTVISSAIMGVSVYSLSKLMSTTFWSLGILVLIGIVIYAFMVFLTKEIRPWEVKTLFAYIKGN